MGSRQDAADEPLIARLAGILGLQGLLGLEGESPSPADPHPETARKANRLLASCRHLVAALEEPMAILGVAVGLESESTLVVSPRYQAVLPTVELLLREDPKWRGTVVHYVKVYRDAVATLSRQAQGREVDADALRHAFFGLTGMREAFRGHAVLRQIFELTAQKNAESSQSRPARERKATEESKPATELEELGTQVSQMMTSLGARMRILVASADRVAGNTRDLSALPPHDQVKAHNMAIHMMLDSDLGSKMEQSIARFIETKNAVRRIDPDKPDELRAAHKGLKELSRVLASLPSILDCFSDVAPESALH